MFEPDGAELFLAVVPYLFGVAYVFSSHYLEPLVADRVSRRIEEGTDMLGISTPPHLRAGFIKDYFEYAFACLQVAALSIAFPAGLASSVASFDGPSWMYFVAVGLSITGLGLVSRFLQRDPAKFAAAQRHRRIPVIERWALGCNALAIVLVLFLAFLRARQMA